MVIIFDDLIVDMIHQQVKEEGITQVNQHPRHKPKERVLIQIMLIHLLEPEVEEVHDISQYKNCFDPDI
jgi:hypothetical protein